MEKKTHGSIIERPRKNGDISYQAMVKIPGAKAAVRTFSDRAQAQAFLDNIGDQRQKAIKARNRHDHWIKPLSPSEQAKLNQEAWANEWLQTTLKLYNDSERITNRFKQPMRTIIKFGGDVKLGELNRKWVRDYLNFARKQVTRTKTPYKWATIVDHMKIISAAMNWWAEELEAKGAKLPFSLKMIPSDWEVKRERRLSLEEERQITLRLRTKRKKSARHWLRMVRLALDTAARLQELVLAEWSEFDLERKYWVIPAAHTKCGKARLVPLNKRALRVLRVMKLAQSPDSPRVFYKMGSPKNASNIFSRMTIQMGIKDFRFHDLRHEAISRMVLKQRQLSVYEIMNIVGHSSVEMLQRYTNLRGDELAAKLIN